MWEIILTTALIRSKTVICVWQLNTFSTMDSSKTNVTNWRSLKWLDNSPLSVFTAATTGNYVLHINSAQMSLCAANSCCRLCHTGDDNLLPRFPAFSKPNRSSGQNEGPALQSCLQIYAFKAQKAFWLLTTLTRLCRQISSVQQCCVVS